MTRKLPETNIGFVNAEGKLVNGSASRIDYAMEAASILPKKRTEEYFQSLRMPDANTRRATQEGKTGHELWNANKADYDVLVASEADYKGLFLDTITDMLRKEGSTVDARQLFQTLAFHPENIRPFYGSRSVMVMHDFKKHDDGRLDKLYSEGSTPPESVTPYGFLFSFMIKKDPTGKTVSVPLFEMDRSAWKTLANYGVTDQQRDAYCENFMRMAGMAEHDYLHQLVLGMRDHAHDVMPGAIAFKDSSPPPSGSFAEDHALAAHAAICAELFARSPKRKERVLGWASGQVERIREIQDTAMAKATTTGEREEIAQIVTYLSEIYFHRLLRVISPEDPDLKKAVAGLDALNLYVPRHLQHDPQPQSGLETLLRLQEEGLKDTYARIHRTGKMNLLYTGMPLDDYMLSPRKLPEPVATPVVAIIDRMARTALPEMDKKHYWRQQQTAEIYKDPNVTLLLPPR